MENLRDTSSLAKATENGVCSKFKSWLLLSFYLHGGIKMNDASEMDSSYSIYLDLDISAVYCLTLYWNHIHLLTYNTLNVYRFYTNLYSMGYMEKSKEKNVTSHVSFWILHGSMPYCYLCWNLVVTVGLISFLIFSTQRHGFENVFCKTAIILYRCQLTSYEVRVVESRSNRQQLRVDVIKDFLDAGDVLAIWPVVDNKFCNSTLHESHYRMVFG